MFNKKILTTSILAALGSMTVSTLGYAQEAEEEAVAPVQAVEVIQVTGIRGALANAAEIKRESSTFVDSITASDASAIPDLSVAEALSRIPGLTVSRFTAGGTAGDFPSPEGSGNLIRGLGFIRSEFNGRDAFSANGGRALDWSAVPTQLVGRVDVFKNQQADLIEGGIGGTINLQTLAPFDNEDGIAQIAADTVYTDIREEWSPTYSGIFGKNFDTDNGKFGFVGSFSSSELQSDINGYQAGMVVPRDNVTGESFADGQDVSNPVGTVALTPGFNLRTNEVDRERESYYLAGQWRSADDNLEVLVKYVTVENEVNGLERTSEWYADAETVRSGGVEVSDLVVSPFTSNGIPKCNGSNEEFAGECDELIPVSGGLMEEGLITDDFRSWAGAYGLRVSNLGIGKQEYSKTDDISINVKWRATDQLTVEFDAHRTTAEASFEEQWIGVNTFLNVFSRPDLDNPYLEFSVDPRTNIAEGNRQDGGTVQVPYVAPTNPADPSGSYVGFANDTFREGEGDLQAVKLDVEYALDDTDGWFQSVKMGVRYSEREQVNKDAGGNWKGVSPLWGGGVAPLNSLEENIYDEVNFSDFFRGGVVGGENTTLLYPKASLLRNPESFYDYLQAEPDFATSFYSPFATTDLNPDNPANPDQLRRTNDGNYTKIYQPGGISDVVEETINLYAMVKFAQDFDNGMWIDGNVGLRYVKNTLGSNGKLSYNEFSEDRQELDDPVTYPGYTQEVEDIDEINDFLPETEAYLKTADSVRRVDVEDEHWLPSLNVKLNLNDDMLIRFGASKGVTRPNMSDLNATQSISAKTSVERFANLEPDDPNIDVPRGLINGTLQNIRINGGNPDLVATTANSFDISYEWYFETGFITFGVFHKDIKNIVQYGVKPVDTINLDNTQVNVNFNGQLNLAEAEVSGFEVAYQDFFTGLPGIWKNFGIQANYTFVDASATPPPQFLDADDDGVPDSADTTFRFGLDNLLGQSEHTGNLIGIYQDDNLEIRLIYNYRSEYLNSYRDFVTGNPVFQKATGFFDASVRYHFNDNLTANLLIANITDEKNKSETQIDEAGTRYQRSSFLNDRRMQVGLTYTF
ncbi:TonB-dependent receptor [Pseudocolwellia sp. AS88]|uniref:TonB-dependent receptor n=1 Tax=Pseudocolwellia sp. AS88 TaxID=3063958 RepID=UPI0026ECDD97|nr:TonB-dependent receptor [Pseudocolwellia sp. AS88]MDO7084478.1 TonB-dependent receptor [Pseudocolwellia sp. AS88]